MNLLEFEEIEQIFNQFKKKEFPDVIINGERGHLLKKVEEKDKLQDMRDKYLDILQQF